MTEGPLYSIGHGSRSKENFLELLKKYQVDHLIDVRSFPYSRFHPQFSEKNLRSYLEENGVRYVFMGDSLGGRPKDPSCYDDNGKVNYDTIRTKDFFKAGISRLKTAYQRRINVAIMCSERDPRDCHRSKLIGKVLMEEQVPMVHIEVNGELVAQKDLK